MSARRVTISLTLLAVSACRGDTTPPPLYTAAAEAPAPAPVADDTPVAEPGRRLWFARGPGRDAILARERQDHVAAVALLDQLLATPDLTPDDRGAAQWLRGLEDLRLQRYADAAARFAEARGAPALAGVGARLRLLEAQAWLDAADPARALTAVGDLAQGADTSALFGVAIIITADARARSDDPTGAAALYDRFLQRPGDSSRRHEVRAKLARLLVASEAREDLQKALALYERLALDVPLSDYGEEAVQRIGPLEQRLGIQKSFAENREVVRQRSLARMRDALARSRYAGVIHDADEFLRLPALTDGDRCEALFLKGSAVFKQRKRTKSRPIFDQAATACRRGAGHQDTLVKSLYQGGRGRYAEADYEIAAKQFTAIADEFGNHSYADDALVLAGESWAERDDRPRERAAYERILKDIPAGDMAGEARRRLVVLAFTQDRLADALTLTDDGLASPARLDLRERAKLHYFRGRALQRQGQTEAAVAAWLDGLAVGPLTYAGMQTLSRLRDVGDDALAKGVAVLERESPGAAVQLELPATPAAQRAQLLARLGLGEAAGEELGEAGIAGWPAAAVLVQAGLYPESQRLLGGLASSWRSNPPVGQLKELWQIAYPLAFGDLVRADEDKHQVPPFLAFAIMQTESVFDPGVTSKAGARGLIQLMPATAADLARQAGLADFNPENLYQPALNLDLGTRYLGNLVRRFGGDDAAVPLAIPSYNAGAGAVDRWLERRKSWDYDLFIEAIPFDETRAYTQSVLERWMTYRWVHGSNLPGEQRIPYIPLAIPGRSTGV